MILFLDFDGVLHPDCTTRTGDLMCHLPLLEEVLRTFQDVEIVISSSWRHLWPQPREALEALRPFFSNDIGLRVIDVTPRHTDLDDRAAPDGLATYHRHWECVAWMRANRTPVETWLALDDRSYWFKPFCAELMVVNGKTGFTVEDAVELRKRFAQMEKKR